MTTANPNYLIVDLYLVGVADPGVPNMERIVIRPTQRVNLLGYGIALGQLQNDGRAAPIFDNCFWFTGFEAAPPSWIVVYTGKGTPGKSVWEGQDVHVFHWQRDYTIFAESDIVPILFRIDAVAIGRVIGEPAKLESGNK